jgi:tetratricopeptide (TPR) repeat protein
MRSILFVWTLGLGLALAQNSSSPASGKAQSPESTSSSTDKTAPARRPNLAPPRSDSVNIADLPDDEGNSSSKDTQIDTSPPPNDAKDHPQSSETLRDEGSSPSDPSELHPWDPHKAAKDIEVGDFYFKRKNYVAAESRYREALYYKNNDALATYRLAECLEKMDRLDDARTEYESYLRILPYGPEAENAKKAIERLKNSAATAKPR